MPLKLEEIEGYTQLMQLVETQGQKIADLECRLAHTMQQPKQRWTTYEANRLFIGSKGKPVDRHTFGRMVATWLANGTLKEGVNFWGNCGQVKFISVDFLKGQIEQTHKQKLKRA